MFEIHHSRFLSGTFAAIAITFACPALAQLRTIPDDAKRGEIRPVREMIVEIDGDQIRLSPGAQIRNRENRIVLPVSLSPEAQLIKYLVEPSGMVRRVWILTEEEAAKPDKKP